MAIAALSLRGAVSELAVPGGSLHTGQEIEFKGAVQVGETLRCLATVAANSVRREWRVIVVKLQVTGMGGREIMAGKSTIMIPA